MSYRRTEIPASARAAEFILMMRSCGRRSVMDYLFALFKPRLERELGHELFKQISWRTQRARSPSVPSRRSFARPSNNGGSVVTVALDFPDGFLWGTATASYQIEGSLFDERARAVHLGMLFAVPRERFITGTQAI